MFKLSTDLISKFPFYKDEWNKMVCTDYQGVYPEQPSNTWFILFRFTKFNLKKINYKFNFL